ncbi:MAG: DUF975 family protein [Clostridia bacterium]|nr:DUF975 family protein [Clostridia bacterium]
MIKSNEIKQIALNKLSGKWTKALITSTIYVSITMLISYLGTLTQNNTITNPIINVALKLLIMPLSFGFISTITKILNGDNPSYSTIFNDSVLNATKVIELFFRILIKLFLPVVLICVSVAMVFVFASNILPFSWDTLVNYIVLLLFVYTILVVIILILLLPYTLSIYVLADNNNISAKEAINKSIVLMEGNKWNFIKLMLSFIGWYILIAVIIALITKYSPVHLNTLIEGVPSILLLPYITSSISVFYYELNDNKVEKVNNNSTSNTDVSTEN